MPVPCNYIDIEVEFFWSSTVFAKSISHKNVRGPGMIRTCDARFRKPTLYPLSYGAGGCVQNLMHNRVHNLGELLPSKLFGV